MRKILLSLGIVFGLVTASYAAVPVPKDSGNSQVVEPAWAGASTCMIDNSTGTADLLCATGKGVVLGVFSSSVAATDFLVLRDSATANHTSTKLFAITAPGATGGPFVAGPKFTNGLVATLSVAPPAATGNWTILYRLQSDQN